MVLIFAPLICKAGLVYLLSVVGEDFQEFRDIRAGGHVQANCTIMEISLVILIYSQY